MSDLSHEKRWERPPPATPAEALRAGASVAREPENAPTDGFQHGFQWDRAGNVLVTQESPKIKRQRRDGLRDDARRTTEYLASRGRTPIESLHNLARLEPWVAIRRIVRETGCTRQWALEFWRDTCVALLPYTAARIDAVDLGQLMAGATGGSMAAAHFLAASAISERLRSAPMSVDHRSPDRSQGLDLGQQSDTVSLPVTQISLPPAPSD